MSFIKKTLFGGAEEDAARAQAEASDRAVAANERALAQAREDLGPFRSAGEGILGLLQNFVATGPEDDLERAEGFKQIQASAAARSKRFSGGTLKDLTEFNNLLNARSRRDRFSELFNLATLGANAGAGQATATVNTARSNADLIVGAGDATAAGIIGANNQRRNIVGGITSFLGSL